MSPSKGIKPLVGPVKGVLVSGGRKKPTDTTMLKCRVNFYIFHTKIEICKKLYHDNNPCTLLKSSPSIGIDPAIKWLDFI